MTGEVMDDLDWVPEGVDTNVLSVARMYDYFLGGAHNFAIDREMAKKTLQARPDAGLVMQANRSFLRRVVKFLTGIGIRQFIDLGSGVPTVGNVHEVAQRYAPGSRVAYVDIDPIAVAHSRQMLRDDPDTIVLQEDMRSPERILGDRRVRALLDFDQPIAVLAVAVLHFIDDADDPAGLTSRIREMVPTGSYLAISHGTADNEPESVRQVVDGVYARSASPMTVRSKDQVMRLFDGWSLIDPGLVWIPQWQPEDIDDDRAPEQSNLYGGVAVKA